MPFSKNRRAAYITSGPAILILLIKNIKRLKDLNSEI